MLLISHLQKVSVSVDLYQCQKALADNLEIQKVFFSFLLVILCVILIKVQNCSYLSLLNNVQSISEDYGKICMQFPITLFFTTAKMMDFFQHALLTLAHYIFQRKNCKWKAEWVMFYKYLKPEKEWSI